MKQNKRIVGVVGVGAFGEFMLKHLIPYFDVRLYDAHRDLTEIGKTYNAEICTLDEVCESDIILLAVPVAHMAEAVEAIKDKLKKGQLVIDLCSVKVVPAKILADMIPQDVEILGMHPLFGPQSGKFGIHGMNLTLCDLGRCTRTKCVKEFLEKNLGLKVHETTPEEHDREMAYVQGLTHMIAKVYARMDVPAIHQKTKTYTLLEEMVEMIRYDSDELFLAIQRDNPFVGETKELFFQAVKDLEEKLSKS
ncbi:MAG TPA: prephenate dehydrogenase/arogenate dehydrogenase family protein [Alphaproteobacteria bacterium]|nr:prephenate dehydrogenase/arogenate dehydrogenase family protein [Alphaproteobacteria bacterium]HNS45138.1 prephenate dehydrogenase/arogenate dehydrogenase family protein [Alphaproteobacteria bacterium]